MISRRQFLRGDISGRQAPLRPPWARPEAHFLSTCTRCGECVKACPENILALVRGYPEVRFAQGACTFCGKCQEACSPQALVARQDERPWALLAQANTNCLAYRDVVCRSCGDACGEAAIRFSPRIGGAARPEILSEHCTGCGACVSACPAGAVTMAAAGGKA
ncbi:MAG: ferredoxin-type protein NapF [Rhodocyclaceae bacterium]|jgi:ferredoxin-type protein NapF|nr:ferredoxin-type protein NapF [Rhodocyclaceae bacterium]